MPRRAQLQAIARQWVSLWCVPVDWMLFDRLHSPEFEDLSSAGRPPTKAGFAAGLAEFVGAFPDLHTTAQQLVVDVKRSQVAIRWSATGTNRHGFLGIGPTLRVTPITGIEIIEVRSGQVVRRWGEWDISAHDSSANPKSP
jgi:predicted ester cyclase